MFDKKPKKIATKKEAEGEAAKVKDKNKLKDLICDEACMIATGAQPDLQPLMAFAKQLMAMSAPKADPKAKK